MVTYYVECPSLRFPRYYVETVSGLSLLRVELPRRWRGAAVGRVQRQMRVTHTLNLPNLPREGIVSRLLPTRELWQRVAPEVALTALSLRRIPPACATVGIFSLRLSNPVWDTMEALSDRVQALTLRLPDGERVRLCLQLRNGIPIREGAADVTLCFSPAQPEPGWLLLGEERPAPAGLALTVPGVDVPEGCPAEGLYAALLAEGKLNARPKVVPEPAAAARPPLPSAQKTPI